MSVTQEKTFQLNDSKTSVGPRSRVSGTLYLSVSSYVISLGGGKTRELPLSRREIASLRGGYVGEGKKAEPSCLMRGMKYFRKPLVKLDVVKARIFAL